MESAVNDNDNNNIDEVKNVVFTNQLNQQQPRRRNKSRTRVERQMDSIRDLSANEREQILDKLIDDSVDDEVEAKAKAELVNPSDYIEGALQRIKNWGQRVGLSSGYYAIDNMTMGFAPGELTIVAGVTSSGKTMMCCNIAANMVKKKHKVVFVTLEMTKEELLSRFWNILGYGYDEVGQKQMAEACRYLRFQQIDRMNWQTIPYLIEQAKSWGAECVFIDHLHYFAREMHDVANELGIITQEFKQAAIKNQLPIILISHTRKIEKGKSHADINDLRGSSYIAQDADIVLMVWQEQGEQTEGIYIGLDKNRNRLNYKIGTAIRHNKCGLVIMDLDDEGVEAADRNSVPSAKPKTSGFVSANPIPTPTPRQPAPILPKKGEPDPWNKPLSQPKLPPIEKEHLNGAIKF
jgi:replicative DNA helicase dnaB